MMKVGFPQLALFFFLVNNFGFLTARSCVFLFIVASAFLWSHRNGNDEHGGQSRCLVSKLYCSEVISLVCSAKELTFGYSLLQGRRPYMEDVYLATQKENVAYFGLFDVHLFRKDQIEAGLLVSTLRATRAKGRRRSAKQNLARR